MRLATVFSLEAIALDAHPGIVSLEERPALERTAERADRQLAERHADAADRSIDLLTPADLADLRAFYWSRVREELDTPIAPGQLMLDKFPLSIVRLPLINRLFPDARVLVALRDPRDVCLSGFRQRFADNAAMSFFQTLDGAADLYAHVMGRWLDVRDHTTLPLLELRYEDTVASFEPQMRKVLEFLGLPWDDAIASFHERRDDRVVATPSYHTVRKPVNTSAVGRWRRYEKGLAPILPRLQPFVEAFGYE